MVVDLKQGSFQVEIDHNDLYKTAFSGPNGHYQYDRMPMGCCDSPNTFMRVISLALARLQGHEIEIYMDDIMIFRENLEQHGKRFKILLKRLAAANLTNKSKKCQFLKRKAKALGNIVGNGQIKTNPEKIVAVKNYQDQ